MWNNIESFLPIVFTLSINGTVVKIILDISVYMFVKNYLYYMQVNETKYIIVCEKVPKVTKYTSFKEKLNTVENLFFYLKTLAYT